VTGAAPDIATAHVDTFVRDRLPPRDQWPTIRFDLADLHYPDRLNCASEILDAAVAAGRGDRLCLVGERQRWTYRELLERANRIAHVLVDDLGVVPGGRVLLRAPNTPMLAACWFAVMKAGAVAVATMPLLRAGELATLIERARIETALCDARLAEELERARGRSDALRRVALWADGEDGELDRRAAAKPARFENVDTAADDPCLIGFTSGTTGAPKGTVHFHRDVMACCDCVPAQILAPRADDVFTGTPPIGFTFGLFGLVCYPLRAGAASVLLERANPRVLLDAVERHRATICFTAPTAYRAWLDRLAGRDVSSLRVAVSSGEALPPSTWRAFKQATGLEIVDCLGSTEMLHSFISTAGHPRRPGSLGKAIRGYEVAVLDASGRRLPPGEAGLLGVQGPTGCRYLDDERQRRQVVAGWNLTGDVVVMDADGYLWYRGRNDDLIVASGYNISAAEVEDALLAHRDVADCGVVGAPDHDRGTIVKAYVVLERDAADDDATVTALQDFVKQSIAAYKYPRAIEFVDRLPRTATGKLQRFRLREAAQSGYGHN
jgi:2-aminobenzoate-CoA ligase